MEYFGPDGREDQGLRGGTRDPKGFQGLENSEQTSAGKKTGQDRFSWGWGWGWG